MGMASFISSLSSPPPPALVCYTRRRIKVCVQIKCFSNQNDEAERVKKSSSSYQYQLCAVLGSIGFLETSYLTYLKLSNSDAFCPITGAGSCGDILNSQYAVVFGVPLPVIGMVAYGLVAALSLIVQQKQNNKFGLFLLGTTTSMAASSAYLLYILTTNFSGTLCPYCLLSAFFSFALFFITLKDVGFQKNLLPLQLCIATLVLVTLSTSYANSQSIPSSLAETDLPYFTVQITTPSTPFALSLANHLHSIGAKMYGAFWCSHCLEQKEMFGSEAAKYLDYVECFPDGYQKGIKINKECSDAKIEGFPTWVINDQVLSGEQDLSDLAEASGFKFNE